MSLIEIISLSVGLGIFVLPIIIIFISAFEHEKNMAKWRDMNNRMEQQNKENRIKLDARIKEFAELKTEFNNSFIDLDNSNNSLEKSTHELKLSTDRLKKSLEQWESFKKQYPYSHER